MQILLQFLGTGNTIQSRFFAYLLGEGVAVFDLSPSVGEGDLLSFGLGILSSNSGISLFSS